MSRFVVVHHAHHAKAGHLVEEGGKPKAGVYRLVFAEEIEHVRYVEAENPDFDPEADISEENPPTVVQQEKFLVHANHQDIVWADDDPKWRKRSKKWIRDEQRRIAKETITKRIAEAERQEAEHQAGQTDLGGVGDAI